MSVRANLHMCRGNHWLGRSPRAVLAGESVSGPSRRLGNLLCQRHAGTSYSLRTGSSSATWVHRSTSPGNTSMPAAAPSDTVTTQLTGNSAPEALLLGCMLQAKASSQRAGQGSTLFPATQETQNARF